MVVLQLADRTKQQEYEAVYDEKGNHISYRVKVAKPVNAQPVETPNIAPKRILNQGVEVKEKH